MELVLEVLCALKGRVNHAKKTLSSDKLIQKLREAEVALAQGNQTAEVCKILGITEHTYYRWQREYIGLKVDQATKLKEVEKEQAQLKRLLAEAGARRYPGKRLHRILPWGSCVTSY